MEASPALRLYHTSCCCASTLAATRTLTALSTNDVACDVEFHETVVITFVFFRRYRCCVPGTALLYHVSATAALLHQNTPPSPLPPCSSFATRIREVMLRRGLMKFVDREPVAAVSLGLGLFGFSLPFIVPPIRQSLGYSTKQVCTAL